MTDHLTQVRRDGDAYLSRHDRFFVVRQQFWIGPPRREWYEDHTVIETGDLADVVRVLPKISGPVAVIGADLLRGTSRDWSKEAALMVAEHIRDGKFSLTDDLRNFVEDNLGVGTVIPAVA